MVNRVFSRGSCSVRDSTECPTTHRTSSYIRGFSADAHAVTTMSGAVAGGGTWRREDATGGITTTMGFKVCPGFSPMSDRMILQGYAQNENTLKT